MKYRINIIGETPEEINNALIQIQEELFGLIEPPMNMGHHLKIQLPGNSEHGQISISSHNPDEFDQEPMEDGSVVDFLAEVDSPV